MSIRPKTRLVIRSILLLGLVVTLYMMGVYIQSRKAEADRLEAYGQLSWMRFALQCYEEEHGRLPPLELVNDQGIPCLSWRAAIFLYVEQSNESILKTALNLHLPWNDDQTQKLLKSETTDWGIFNRNNGSHQKPAITHIVAYRGKESIWDAKSGQPKSKTDNDPESVLLLWTPRGRFHPLQPGDMSEEELRQSILNGEEILFIKCGKGNSYGITGLKDGRVVFDQTIRR